MTTTTDMRAKLATEFSRAFETRKRADGTEFVTLRDGSPEWMRDAVHAAHGDMLPDDMRYSMIEDAADGLADADPDGWDDMAHEIADGMVSCYCADRARWLASSLDRQGYCDEAIEEFGPPSSVDDMLAQGWCLEAREIVSSVRQSIEDRADELDEDA